MDKNVIIAIFGTILFMLATFFIVSVFTDCISIKSSNHTNIEDFEVGDRFETIMESPDPFRKPFIYRGTIIAFQGDYAQYITENGDTSSTNFAYECQNFKVKKLPK